MQNVNPQKIKITKHDVSTIQALSTQRRISDTEVRKPWSRWIVEMNKQSKMSLQTYDHTNLHL